MPVALQEAPLVATHRWTGVMLCLYCLNYLLVPVPSKKRQPPATAGLADVGPLTTAPWAQDLDPLAFLWVSRLRCPQQPLPPPSTSNSVTRRTQVKAQSPGHGRAFAVITENKQGPRKARELPAAPSPRLPG